ncbi:MAG: Cof-type HAD-IIB family hydrolase [Solirubrobacteraceae bacterium]|jgi:Cof subfamily protein (haloacid dehalogenase superfamily)
MQVSLNPSSSGPSPSNRSPSSPSAIRLLLADVDGTLVTPAKELTDAAIAAVRELDEAGVLFALTSGRPPRGMAMLIEPLDVRTPIAAFNGGLLVERDMSVIEQHTIPAELVAPTIALLKGHGLDVWLYRGADWFVQDLNGPHVDREAATVQFAPTLRADYDGLVDQIAKIVGVSDDHDAVARAATDAHDRFGDHVSAARSQPYYVDVTHPQANKGCVVEFLARRYEIPEAQIATIGDMANDVLMFARSGLSVAMGNADREVQRAARRVTGSNEHDGFAEAVRRFVLPGAAQRSER